ncbi:adenylosuccinate lyase, partial [Candidatus Beckwithbacteria bacterium CG10_big_fil_rev_8_21_14_0_10_34_10]
ASRGSYFLKKIMALKIEAKLNGAVGNYNSFYQIYPDKNWLKFSQDFIKSFSLNPNLITTQIEPNSSLVYYLDLLRQLNNVWLDLAKDSWLYISFNYFFQKRVRKEIGSSTMPHKINPINFENAEGNFELSNSLLSFMANKLPLSRLQRDLSDSTIKRNLGIVFSYSLLGVKSLIKGLNKIKPNQEQIKKDLNSHPEVLSEALQLFFKTKGRKKAYEKVKLQTRGKKISWKDLIKSSSPKDKKVLSSWQVSKYTGLASFLTIKEIKNIKNKLKI